MTIYRRKAVDVEAVRWRDGNLDEVLAFLGACEVEMAEPRSIVASCQGVMPIRLNPGEWVIRYRSELTVITHEEFLRDYEAIASVENGI